MCAQLSHLKRYSPAHKHYRVRGKPNKDDQNPAYLTWNVFRSRQQSYGAGGPSLIQNHPFVDGNQRVGQVAMEVFFCATKYEIEGSVD